MDGLRYSNYPTIIGTGSIFELLLQSRNFLSERNSIMLLHPSVVEYQFSEGVRFNSYGMFLSEDPLWQAVFAYQS
ncbi:hypothetical protein SAMN05216179_0758 [Gracilibacillus kekensis]|uniref:Uncharacterized protein n=1 Tax=Gracilibacillus kekensis TaxID=1027249 RepID=A0A1M7KKZ2_9BACI|nr:hypothetical protein SAMN05216179_0758 [Gracilibacillus kekensis]